MNPKLETFYSNGKLLLTGEYVVLDGALSLALPTKLGQSLTVETIDEPNIIWNSYDEKANLWFENEFLIGENFSKKAMHHDETSQRVIQILNALNQLKPKLFSSGLGFKLTTKLDFPRDWGLGTSSTLINNMANWANVDAFALLEKTFGGSGYDIACGKHNSAITYQLLNTKREVCELNFNPAFKEHLYFVYLNKKQNSREGISIYRSNSADHSREITAISEITTSIITCKTLEEFELLINQHEFIIADIIKQKTIKEIFFEDFNGSIKSLGAWGGDFVLATSKENPSEYFKLKGFETVLVYGDLIK